MATKIELARLAAAANIIRPDWPTASLQTLLEQRHAHRPYHDLAVALTWIAADPDSRTPARLDEDGPWWRATRTGDPTPIPPPMAEAVAASIAGDDDDDPRHYDGLTCRVCGTRFTTEAARYAHATGPADDCRARVNARGVARVREALAHATAQPDPEETTP